MTTLMHLTSAIGNHLWQSTVLAAVAWLLTLALRKNQARTRYWLWMIASLKFLVPFSLLISMGGYLRALIAIPIAVRPELSVAMEQIATPFPQWDSGAVTAVAAIGHSGGYVPFFMLAIWICGFLFVAFSWGRKWWRVRAAVRAAARSALVADVPVLSSQRLLEPGIFGIFRPVLMLPEGITERLTSAQVDAIVAHEMCHVRRRDNLTAAIHMFVEAVFWFHPMVWWIGSRMVEERERACDEEVLRLGGDPETYAEGILNVCKFYVESPLTCVSGISGSDLKKRILRIMTERLGGKLSPGRKLLLAAVGVVAVAMPIVFGLVNSPQVRAQSPQPVGGPLPSFEVASIKPDHSQAPGTHIGIPTGRFTATNVTTKELIKFAYNSNQGGFSLRDDQVSGGPSWIGSEKYDIDAKVQDSLVEEEKKIPFDQWIIQIRLMLQSLLEDRFKLKVSHATRELAVYVLVVAKNGPKLTESAVAPLGPPGSNSPSSAPSRGPLLDVKRDQITSVGMGVGAFSEVLSRQPELGGRMVLDQTGLKERYDFTLHWTPENPTTVPNGPDGNQGPANAPSPDSSGPSIFTAIQEQLGLKLDSKTAPIDVLVIDHIEQPSPN